MRNTFFKYTIKSKQKVIMLFPMIAKNVILFLILYYWDNGTFRITYFYSFIFLFFLDTLPTLILYVQYYLYNRNAILEIDTDSKRFHYSDSNFNYDYSFNEINSLDYFRTYGKGSGLNSFGMYRYYRIVFQDGSHIFITCLLINNIENTLEQLLNLEAKKHFNLLNLLK